MRLPQGEKVGKAGEGEREMQRARETEERQRQPGAEMDTKRNCQRHRKTKRGRDRLLETEMRTEVQR